MKIKTEGLTDYKFFCFDGKPFCVQVDSGRFESHHQNFYDMEWKSLGVHCTYPEGEGIDRPAGFEEMKRLASQLSKDFPFVRVDLYNVGGKIYFGELTFYPSSGYGKFKPETFDFEMGTRFINFNCIEYGRNNDKKTDSPSEWGGSLVDYKFFCFNGVPKYLYVVTDRKPGEYAYFGVYDIDFNKLPVYRCDERRAEYAIPKPKNYDQMVEIARTLSADFPHVRVNLYNIDGKIYFGELTFYDGSGYFHYDPDEFDFEMGRCFTEY